MGLYKRSGSRFWWMGYTVNGAQFCESTKTTSKDLAEKIWKHREAEIALGRFKIGWPGEKLKFEELCTEFEQSHFAGLTENTVKGHRAYLKHLKAYFEGRKLMEVTTQMVEQYRDLRKMQPLKYNPEASVKGATINRELECLKCIFDLAVQRKYIPENPAVGVKHFNELRERPAKRMIDAETLLKILKAAPIHLRVGIILLVETGGRTYSEGFSLRRDQVDLVNKVVLLHNNVKTEASADPVPLTELACEVLRRWMRETEGISPYLFPSPRDQQKPIRSVKTAWHNTLERAGVAYFPIYQLRHVFCTKVSWVAPDAVVQRAMRHSSPETKRHYQLSMVDQVREAAEKANEKFYGRAKVLHFYDSRSSAGKKPEKAACN